MAFCDLHTHSYYSDGTCSPSQLISQARQLQLSAVALCDHNTVAGLPEFVAAASEGPVEAVPGVEFSTDYLGLDLHVVMLFVQPQHYDLITKRLNEMRQAKAENNQMLVQALRRAGMMVDYEALAAPRVHTVDQRSLCYDTCAGRWLLHTTKAPRFF